MADDNNFEVDLDLLDEGAVAEDVAVDLDADPLAEPNPAEDGVHRVKVIAGTGNPWTSKFWTDKKTNERHDYLSCKFRLQILDEGVDLNKSIFPQAITTNTFGGKNEMAHLLVQIYGGGDDAKAKVGAVAGNYIALGKAFKAALASDPVVQVSTRWVAQVKTGEQKKGRDVYRTVLTGMKNFKKRADGTYDPNIAAKEGETKARATVTGYFPDGHAA